MTAQYSTMQKLSLAGMTVGALLCLVGACAPYWIISDPQGFDGLGQLVGRVVKGRLGLFMVCLEAVGHEECRIIDTDNDSGWFHTARVGASVCVLLGCVCGGVALCLACCTCCKRFIVLGIAAFLAAVAGAYCVIVFSKNTESFTGSVMGFQLTAYGWAYYMFIAGVGVLGLASFTGCFSAPENPLRGVVLGQPTAPGGQVIVSSSTTTAAHHPYMHLQEQGAPPVMGAALHSGLTVATSNGY